MKYLYIILLACSFLMGWYDNGDMTYFVFLLLGGIIAGADKLIERINKRKRKEGE